MKEDRRAAMALVTKTKRQDGTANNKTNSGTVDIVMELDL